jgi:hypothetical protein
VIKSRRWLWVGLFLAVVATVGYYRVATHEAPAGQPPLVMLDAGTLPALRADFNRAATETRIILLLSPT